MFTTNTRGFVRTEGTHFILNGSPFYFNGFNSYWMMHVAADPSGIERNKVSKVFHDAVATGLSVCRTWAFIEEGHVCAPLGPMLPSPLLSVMVVIKRCRYHLVSMMNMFFKSLNF
ncbi:hypothetical protein HYC85_025413 [Camellia sinensis]|uniref:Uncharacterized protein n=1 Tax=Camellia sinensis TaxID=4442 RepID=A0A7J7GBE3_CAMSI|nr:hypothetical protein HYC85_025413 [Camellia sinensis]